MKRLIFAALALLTCYLAYGQETKPVSKKSSSFREEFNVLATDKKVKHGPYKKYQGKDQLIADGQYENNIKVGEWKFYFSGELVQTYDFTGKDLKYLKKAEFPSQALIDGRIQEVLLDFSPTYIGAKVALSEELNKEMTYPQQALRMGIEGKVLASVWISESGEISDVKVLRGIMDECDKEVVKGLSNAEKNWIAGTKDGHKVKSELVIVVEFKLHEGGSKTITVL